MVNTNQKTFLLVYDYCVQEKKVLARAIEIQKENWG